MVIFFYHKCPTYASHETGFVPTLKIYAFFLVDGVGFDVGVHGIDCSLGLRIILFGNFTWRGLIEGLVCFARMILYHFLSSCF